MDQLLAILKEWRTIITIALLLGTLAVASPRRTETDPSLPGIAAKLDSISRQLEQLDALARVACVKTDAQTLAAAGVVCARRRGQ